MLRPTAAAQSRPATAGIIPPIRALAWRKLAEIKAPRRAPADHGPRRGSSPALDPNRQCPRTGRWRPLPRFGAGFPFGRLLLGSWLFWCLVVVRFVAVCSGFRTICGGFGDCFAGLRCWVGVWGPDVVGCVVFFARCCGCLGVGVDLVVTRAGGAVKVFSARPGHVCRVHFDVKREFSGILWFRHPGLSRMPAPWCGFGGFRRGGGGWPNPI
jgi:hypothetical protein